MSTYHVNPDTGATGRCRANNGGCPFGGKTGSENHFDNAVEAIDHAEKLMENQYGGAVKSSRKKTKEFTVPASSEIEGYGNKGWLGGNRNKLTDTSNKNVAKHIRQDLKEATDAGYLPDDLSFSVTSTKDSVNVEIAGPWRNRDLYELKMVGDHSRYEFKPEYQEIMDKVKAIHDSYNYDASNIRVDHFNRGYYGQVALVSEPKG